MYSKAHVLTITTLGIKMLFSLKAGNTTKHKTCIVHIRSKPIFFNFHKSFILLFAQSHSFSHKASSDQIGRHNAGCRLDLTWAGLYLGVYNARDSWPAVNACNKAEGFQWWKSPGVRLGWVMEEMPARMRDSVCLCFCARDQNSRWERVGVRGGRLRLCVKSVWGLCACVYLSENETELVSARLGVCTPGAKCIRLSWSVCLSLAIVHFEGVPKLATACQDNSLYRVEWRMNNVLHEWNQLHHWHLYISLEINNYMAQQ